MNTTYKNNLILLKSALITAFILCLYLPNTASGQGKKVVVEKPVLIDSAVYLYEAGDIYLSGQPDKVALDKLAREGVSLVINIRTQEEIEFHNSQLFNEQEYVEGLNMGYVNIPVGGDAGFTDEAVAAVAKGIGQTDGKVLLHCRTAGRATLVFMAWLINYQKFSVRESFEFGKAARFSFPLEDLLGYPLKMKPGRKKR